MRKLTSIIIIIVMLLISGCTSDSNQLAEYNNTEEKSEFCLISETEIIELGMNISKVNMEPTGVEYGSGDGFKWTVNQYVDIKIKTLLSDDDKNIINKISTNSPAYKTTRGIGVGDNVMKLIELHKEYLTHCKSPENDYYVFDPENDIGFKKIYFHIENNLINEIVIEDGIDG